MAAHIFSAKRHKSVILHGEAGQVYRGSVKDSVLLFCRTLAKYMASLIYNIDESGLIYQLLANIAYLAPDETRKETRGLKAMKSNNLIRFTM